MRRPEFRALYMVLGRHRSCMSRRPDRPGTHGLELPPPWCAAYPRHQGGSSGGSAGLTGLSETKPVRHKRPVQIEFALSRQRPATNTRLHTRHRNRALHPASVKRSGLKRVVCYRCYAFKVCPLCGVGLCIIYNTNSPPPRVIATQPVHKAEY